MKQTVEFRNLSVLIENYTVTSFKVLVAMIEQCHDGPFSCKCTQIHRKNVVKDLFLSEPVVADGGYCGIISCSIFYS